jgi:hypothetical protein
LSHLPNLEDVKNLSSILSTYIPHIDKEKGAFRNHGLSHYAAVERYVDEIINICELSGNPLTITEKMILKCACWLHDLGRILDGEHAYNSVQIINKMIQTGHLNLGDIEDEVRWVVITHSSEGTKRLEEVNEERILAQGERVRLKFLCCLFKIADECDMNRHRAPRPVYEILKDQMPRESKEFWLRHKNVISAEFSLADALIIINMSDHGEEAVVDDLQKLLSNDIISSELEKHQFPLKGCDIRYRRELDDI